jgi:hypothetical protein
MVPHVLLFLLLLTIHVLHVLLVLPLDLPMVPATVLLLLLVVLNKVVLHVSMVLPPLLPILVVAMPVVPVLLVLPLVTVLHGEPVQVKRMVMAMILIVFKQLQGLLPRKPSVLPVRMDGLKLPETVIVLLIQPKLH